LVVLDGIDEPVELTTLPFISRNDGPGGASSTPGPHGGAPKVVHAR
jgi:hypothetical protein